VLAAHASEDVRAAILDQPRRRYPPGHWLGDLPRGRLGRHGPADDDVVDSGLCVCGVQGLRVVDVSVFPAQPAGNTAAPTQAITWIAANRILAED
jgi:choline dehydrogenase-like flavoprotein